MTEIKDHESIAQEYERIANLKDSESSQEEDSYLASHLLALRIEAFRWRTSQRVDEETAVERQASISANESIVAANTDTTAYRVLYLEALDRNTAALCRIAEALENRP